MDELKGVDGLLSPEVLDLDVYISGIKLPALGGQLTTVNDSNGTLATEKMSHLVTRYINVIAGLKDRLKATRSLVELIARVASLHSSAPYLVECRMSNEVEPFFVQCQAFLSAIDKDKFAAIKADGHISTAIKSYIWQTRKLHERGTRNQFSIVYDATDLTRWLAEHRPELLGDDDDGPST